LTIKIDDAGYGDLLYGVVIGAYRPETNHFIYDLIDVKYWQGSLYERKEYLEEAGRITLNLLGRLEPKEDEPIQICQGNILDKAAEVIAEKYGEDRIDRCSIENRAQYLVEMAYLNELRNLGYEPLEERTKNWAKNFWDMYHWIEEDKKRLRWAKKAWPRLQRYKLFRRGK
jgi:hypothetical protein